MNRILSRLASLGVSCSLLLLAMHGTASATIVPELDPGTALSGLTLAVGAGLLLVEWVRHRKSRS